MDGSADVAWALTAWPTAACALVLAAPSACARSRSPGCGCVGGRRRERPAPSRRRARRRRRSPRRRSQAARSPCRLLVSRRLSPPALWQQGWQRQWRRPSPRPFRPASSRSDRLPRKRRRKRLASSRRISLHRTSPRRISIWRGGLFRPWCRYRSCRRHRPWRRRRRRRAPCRCGRWPRRCDRSNRCARPCRRLVRCGGVVARAVVGCGLRVVGAARGGRCVLARDCRCCWRPYCCRPAPRNCRLPADGSESGRADLAAAFWKDAFADTSDVTLTTGDPRAELSATIQQGPGHPLR